MEKNIYSKNIDQILDKDNTSFNDFIDNLNLYVSEEGNNNTDNNDNENESEYNDDFVKNVINNFETETKKILEKTLKRIKKHFYLVPYTDYNKIKDI